MLAQPPIHILLQWLTKIMVDLSLQNPHCDLLSQFTELLEHHQDTVSLHQWSLTIGCAVNSSSKIIQQRALPSSFSIFSAELHNHTCNTAHYTEFSTMWRHMYQLTTSHSSALLNHITSSFHSKCDQRDRIESITHPQTQIHSVTLQPK